MTEELIFPPHKGWDPFAPTRTLPPDGEGYRDMQNFRLGDAFLERRAMMIQPSLAFEQPDTLPVLTSKQEFPIHLWLDQANFTPLAICITNYRLLLNVASLTRPWHTVNPVTDSGTGASWAVGNPVVTNVIATANKYAIVPGDLLTKSSTEVIGVVQSYNAGLNEITLKEPPLFAGVAQPWEVRKAIQYDRAHFRYFNGDLYVTATWETFDDSLDSRDKWGVVFYPTPAKDLGQVVQVEPLAQWLVANTPFDGDPTIAADSPPNPPGPPPPYRQIYNNVNGNQVDIPNNLIDYDENNVILPEAPVRSQPKGLDLLQDGRVVVPLSTELFSDRVFYSSQIQQPQIHWNTSPGGFVDPVGVEGEIQVMGRLGNQLTLHYLHGIMVGTPTGQDDPPLAFQATRENQGCTFWRTLVNVNPAVETFLGPDFQLYTFNGSAVDRIGSNPKVALPQPGIPNGTVTNESDYFSSWDGYEREISVWRFRRIADIPPPEETTYRAVFNFDKGVWTRDKWNFFLTAVSRDYGFLNNDGLVLNTNRRRYALNGVTNRNGQTTLGTFYQGMLGVLGETEALEFQPDWIVEPPPPSYVQLDNFGLGVQTIELEYVIVELRHDIDGGAADEIVTVTPIFDGVAAPSEARAVSLPALNQSRVYSFENFNNASGEKFALRIELNGNAIGNTFEVSFGVIRLGYNPVGEVRSEGQDVD